MDASWIYGHMVTSIYSSLDTGGESTYPVAHLTHWLVLTHSPLPSGVVYVMQRHLLFAFKDILFVYYNIINDAWVGEPQEEKGLGHLKYAHYFILGYDSCITRTPTSYSPVIVW